LYIVRVNDLSRDDLHCVDGYGEGALADVPHLVAAKEGAVIVQLSGTGKFGTDYLEK
jgi:hypothetical protein